MLLLGTQPAACGALWPEFVWLRLLGHLRRNVFRGQSGLLRGIAQGLDSAQLKLLWIRQRDVA
jgi:hypothetical protein